VVLGLDQGHAFGGHQLRNLRGPTGQGLFHGFDERRPDVIDNLTTGRTGIRVETEIFEDAPDHFDVVSRLGEVLLELLLQVGVEDALEGGLVDPPPLRARSPMLAGEVL
jgi:hypothetical protein